MFRVQTRLNHTLHTLAGRERLPTSGWASTPAPLSGLSLSVSLSLALSQGVGVDLLDPRDVVDPQPLECVLQPLVVCQDKGGLGSTGVPRS